MLETGSLVEGVEGKLLNERDAINHDVVTLGSELDFLDFFASYDRTHVWLVDAYDTIGDAFLGVVTLMMVSLLTVYLRYRLYFCEVPVRKESCAWIIPVEPSQLSEYLFEM